MADIGKFNRLPILRDTPQGLYLNGGEEHGDILLPGSLVPQDVSINDLLTVFVYLDSEDRLVATTEIPKATIGQFAKLEVVGINRQVGAFLDWGLQKDLLLPFREQPNRVDVGHTPIVYIHLDPQTNRIVASARLNRHLSKYRPRYAPGAEVDLVILDETPLGYNAIVDHQYRGLLYKNELSEKLEYGRALKGFVKKVRPDGKLDLRRDNAGYTRVGPLADKILQQLEAHKGYLPYDDKTPPEVIRRAFDCSKKAFKQAIGNLYKQRKIQIQNGGIALTPQQPNSSKPDQK
ncbi:MAG: S1-like domain-containing RNA-binding protein [Verrucomicrobiota bacterium]